MKSYLKFLSRNKLYTAIEAVGLTVSLAFVILIGSYVVQQFQVAHDNPDWNRIYSTGTNEFAALGYYDKEEVEMAVPEVETASRLSLTLCSYLDFEGDKIPGIRSLALEVDPEFFDLFPYIKVLEGSKESFELKNAMMLSESMAERVRRDGEDIIGRNVVLNNKEYVIVGVVQDIENSILQQVDVLANAESSMARAENSSDRFSSIGTVTTLFRFRKDVSRQEIESKINAAIEKAYSPGWGEYIKAWHPWRMDDIFWKSTDKGNGVFKTGNRQMVLLLSIVVLLLLISAVFNYINLSFALSGKRAKEMATRRMLGAGKKDVIWKGIGESVLFTAICFIASLALARLLVPMMNDLLSTYTGNLSFIDMDVKLRLLLTPGYVAVYLACILVLGVICGLLPAWASSRYEPIDIMKGMLRRKSKMVFSKVFIVAQVALAVFLISMAMVMEAQMKHMLARPVHCRVDNLYYIDYYATTYDQMKLFKDKVEQLPFVEKVGVGRNFPGFIHMSQGVILDDNRTFTLPVVLCDTTYFDLMGLEIQSDFNHPRLHSIWLDESAFVNAEVSDSSVTFARRFGINGAKADYIGGIVHDFPTGSASVEEVSSLNAGVIVCSPEETFFSHGLLIGTFGESSDYERQILKAYEEYRVEQFGVYESPWHHGFIRDIYKSQLAPVCRTMRLVELFMLLSVLLAMLGLLAMSTYFAGENTKQIAVRKVFGGDVSSETWRSVKSYMILVMIACLIGVPLAISAARLYLQRFAYRVEGYQWGFALAVVITVLIAFATVLWQILKAARTNPAEELKKE